MAEYTIDKIEYSGNVYKLQDSGALQLTGGSVTGPVTFGDTITVDDATLGTMVVNGNASFTNKINGVNVNKTTIVPFVKGTQTGATGSWTGVCNDIDGLYDGLTIAYWLPYAGSGNATLNLTINGTATGAKNCYYGGANRLTTHYGAGNIIYLTYQTAANVNGTTYEGWWAHSQYYSDYTVAYSWTAAATAAKTFSANYFYSTATKQWFHVCLIYGNTYAGAITFNINGQGAKAVYINGTASSSSNYSLAAGWYTVYWDGTNFYVRTDGKITANITGDAATVGGKTVGINVPSNAVFTDSTVSTLTLASGSTAGTALSHGGKYTLTAGTKTVSFTMPSAPSVPTSAASKVTGITASTTATKTTLGTAFTIPNVTSAGSASTWAFEDVACDDITSWSAGSASTWAFTGVTTATGTINATVSGEAEDTLTISLATTTVQSKSSGGNGTAPSLSYTAKTASHVKSGGNGSAPTLGTAFTVPNVTGNTSATVSITDPGHTHTLS